MYILISYHRLMLSLVDPPEPPVEAFFLLPILAFITKTEITFFHRVSLSSHKAFTYTWLSVKSVKSVILHPHMYYKKNLCNRGRWRAREGNGACIYGDGKSLTSPTRLIGGIIAPGQL